MAFSNLLGKTKRIESNDSDTNLKILTKNSAAFPVILKEISIMKRGIVMLARNSGGTQRDNAKNFFSSSLDRENAYESRMQDRKSTSPMKMSGGGMKGGNSFLDSIMGGGLSGLLIKGGLITGILYLIGKFFSSSTFRDSAINMVGELGKTVFGEDVWKDVKSNVTNAFLALGGAILAFKATMLLLDKAMSGLASWLMGGSSIPSGGGKAGRGPQKPGGKAGGFLSKGLKVGGRAAMLLTVGYLLKQAYDLVMGSQSGEDGENGSGSNGLSGIPGGSMSEITSGVASGAALVGGNILANKATSALNARTSAKVGAPTKFNANANRYMQGGKFVSTKNLPLGTILEKLKNYLLQIDKRGLKMQLLRRVSAKFGISVALKLGAFMTSIVAAPLTAGASLIITAAMLAWNLSFVYELYEFLMEDADALKNTPSESDIEKMAEKLQSPERNFTTNENTSEGSSTSPTASKESTGSTASQVPSSGGVGMALPKGVSINSKSAIDYLVSKGLTPAQAAGVVGNLIQESTLNSGAFNKSEGAYGLAQWRGSRLQDLQQFASSRGKDIGDVNTQLDFIMHELSGKERKAGAMLASSTTAEEAAFNFGKYYERPKVVEQSRVQYANTALKEYGAGGNTTGSDLMNAATNAAANKANITGGNTIFSAPTNNNNNGGTGGNVNLPSAGVYDIEFIKMLVNRAVGSSILT
jgi:hypothetical protein